MNIQINYFGMIAEAVEKEQESLEFEGNSAELLEFLKNKYPGLDKLSFKLAINQSLIQETTDIEENMAIALLPPFAGG